MNQSAIAVNVDGVSKRFTHRVKGEVWAARDVRFTAAPGAFVTLPLILPAFFAGLGVVFIRSMTAISATIFLVSIGWTLITVKILQDMTELALGPAAAFSVLVVVIVFAMIALIGRVLSLFRAQGAPRVTSMLGG